VRCQRLRSLGVSLVTTLIDFGLFALCTLILIGSALTWARWLSGAVGAVCNFLLNRSWAFAARGERLAHQAARYGVTALIAVSAATLVFAALRLFTPWDARLLHLLSLGLVWLGFTFPMLRGWVFRRSEAG
jgi:putative flippase GtrA